MPSCSSRRPSRSTRPNAGAHYIYGVTLVSTRPRRGAQFVKLAPTAPNAGDCRCMSPASNEVKAQALVTQVLRARPVTMTREHFG